MDYLNYEGLKYYHSKVKEYIESKILHHIFDKTKSEVTTAPEEGVVYFTSDTHEIIINGQSYGPDLLPLWNKISEVEIVTSSALNHLNDVKQDKMDNDLETTSKSVVGAINELNARFDEIGQGGTIEGAYLPLAGGTMSGDITMSGESKLIFGNTSVYNNGDLFIGGGIQVDGSLSVSNMITASGFQHATNSSNDYVLLAGGGTKLLSEISSPDMSGYLPLTGGTLTGSFNVSSIFSVSTTAEETTPIVLGDTSNKSVKINYSASYDNEGELDIINNPHLIIGPPNSAALFLNRAGIQAVGADNTQSNTLYLNPQGGVIKLGGGLETQSYINAASLSLSGGISCGSSDMLKYGTTHILQYDASNSHIYIGENQVDSISETITLSANNVNAYNNITANGDINAAAFYETSDVRKKDIKSDLSLDKCYDLIDKCQTVIYSLKDQTKEQVGMIAQEIEEFFPEVVATDEEGFKSLAYDRLVVICFKVLKDVIKRLEKLENV